MTEKDKTSISRNILFKFLKKKKKIGTMLFYLYCPQTFNDYNPEKTNLEVMEENIKLADEATYFDDKKRLLGSIIGHMCTPILNKGPKKDLLFYLYCDWKDYILQNWREIKKEYEKNI